MRLRTPAPSIAGRIHRWPLDIKTGGLVLQGGLILGDNWWLASSAPKTSNPKADGKLISAAPGKAHQERGWADSPQDMMFDAGAGAGAGADLIWDHNWTSGKRSIFAVKRTALDQGCQSK